MKRASFFNSAALSKKKKHLGLTKKKINKRK
jgi:hypothetical protein